MATVESIACHFGIRDSSFFRHWVFRHSSWNSFGGSKVTETSQDLLSLRSADGALLVITYRGDW